MGSPDLPGKTLLYPCALSANCMDQEKSLNLCELGEVRGSRAFVMIIMLCQSLILYLCALKFILIIQSWG